MSKQKFVKKDANGNSTDNPSNYVRIGADYYRIIEKVDRFGIPRIELKIWKKDEIRTDFGRTVFDTLMKYPDSVIVPDNLNYQPIIHGCYNMYRPFAHTPREGEFPWSQTLMEHVFGEQVELGYRYMNMLYRNPMHLGPILALVSSDRQTGKTTFVNWLNMIFGGNMTIISPEDLKNTFNIAYAESNIIAIEETLFDNKLTVDKLKALSTGKFVSVNKKFVNQFKTNFYGKIIITSNNEDKFASIDDNEIRFFVRKLGTPINANHNVENDLLKEIPAFLHHLLSLPPVDFGVDRTGFTPIELNNEFLEKVKRESKSWLYKSLHMLIEDLFLNEFKGENEFKADIISIRDKFFPKDSRVDLSFIRNTLKNEFNLIPSEKSERFYPFVNGEQKSAKAYLFKRENFTTTEVLDEKLPF